MYILENANTILDKKPAVFWLLSVTELLPSTLRVNIDRAQTEDLKALLVSFAEAYIDKRMLDTAEREEEQRVANPVDNYVYALQQHRFNDFDIVLPTAFPKHLENIALFDLRTSEFDWHDVFMRGSFIYLYLTHGMWRRYSRNCEWEDTYIYLHIPNSPQIPVCEPTQMEPNDKIFWNHYRGMWDAFLRSIHTVLYYDS